MADYVELSIKTPKLLKIAKAFFAEKLTEADYEEYPVINTKSNDGKVTEEVCTISFSDRKRKYGNGNKTAVTLTDPVLSALKARFFQVTNVNPSKPFLCFVIYVMQNLIDKSTGKTVFNTMKGLMNGRNIFTSVPVETKNVNNKHLDNQWDNLVYDLCSAVNRFDYGEFKSFLEDYASDMPEDFVTAKKKQLKEQIKNGDFSFPMKEFFKIYDEETKKYVTSIYMDSDIFHPVNAFLSKISEYYNITLLHKLNKPNIQGSFKDVATKYHKMLTQIPKIMDKIQKNNFKEFTIKEFFVAPVLEDWNESLSSAFESIFADPKTNISIIGSLYKFLQKLGLMPNNINENKINSAVQGTLESLNARQLCYLGRDDFAGDAFEDMSFNNIDSFTSYEGYCFSLMELASMIVSKKGLVVVDNVTFSKEFIKGLIHDIAKYISNHAGETTMKYEIQALKESFKANFSTDNVDNDTLTLTLSGIPDIVITNPFKIQKSYDAWKDFYSKIINDYATQVKLLSVRKVYEKSCNTIFEITGLLGYMCLADDITIFENDGSYFYTSEHCKEQYKHLMNNEIKDLSIKEDISTISFNNKTFEDLIKELDTASCIHGIGNSFLRYYIHAYEAGKEVLPYILNDAGGIFKTKLNKLVRDYKLFVETVNEDLKNNEQNGRLTHLNVTVDDNIQPDAFKNIKNQIELNRTSIGNSTLDLMLKKEFQQNLKWYLEEFETLLKPDPTRNSNAKKLKPVPNNDTETIKKMFKMAPFIVEAPEKIKKQTGLAYLTCVYMDKSLKEILTNNPNNYSLLVFGYTENPNQSVKCMYLRSNQFTTFVKYKDVEHLFILKDPYKYDSRRGRFKVEGYETYQHRWTFENYYSDPKNVGDLMKLAQIPFLFHRQRTQTFQVFKDYCLNLCEMMDASLDAPAPISKAKSLAQIAKKPVYDFMTLEESYLIPRYLTVVNSSSKNMWNTGFNIQSLQDPSNYFIDSLQNFITLPYVLVKEGNKNKPVVKSPFGTNKDLTSPYQKSTLLAKMLIEIDDPYEGKEWQETVLTQYYYFESYFKMVNDQDSSLRAYLLHNIEDELLYQESMGNDTTAAKKEAETIQKQGKIDTITIVKYFDEIKSPVLKVAIMKRMQVFIGLFYIAFFKFNPKHYHCFNYAKDYYTSPEQELLNCANFKITPSTIEAHKKRLFTLYTNLLDDYVKALCYEGLIDTNMQYHFTELRKEYYLLASLKSQFQRVPFEMTTEEHTIIADKYDPDHQDTIKSVLKKQTTITEMITTLNTVFAYYKDDLKLKQLVDGDKLNANLHAESIPRALEYLIKVRLVDAHKTRLYGAILPFEKMIEFAFKGNMKREYTNLEHDHEKLQSFKLLLLYPEYDPKSDANEETICQILFEKIQALMGNHGMYVEEDIEELYESLFNYIL